MGTLSNLNDAAICENSSRLLAVSCFVSSQMNDRILNTQLKRVSIYVITSTRTQKQPSRGILIKMCSKNMQQIYRNEVSFHGTPMLKFDFNKVATQLC